MTQRIIEKTKDVEAIYIENSLLANKVSLILPQAKSHQPIDFGCQRKD
jgi:hypothetical protein